MDRTKQPGGTTPIPITAAPGAECPGQGQVEQHLAAFDQLDFKGWNDRDWELFRRLHTDNVKVVGFGQATEGIDDHVNWAKAFIAANPESKILAHPIRIGADDWTAVTGLMNDGTTMATIARWENGRIAEEFLFGLSG